MSKRMIVELCLTAIFATVICTPIFIGVICVKVDSRHDRQVKQLPSGAIVIEEKDSNWWIVEVDGARFLAHWETYDGYVYTWHLVKL